MSSTPFLREFEWACKGAPVGSDPGAPIGPLPKCQGKVGPDMAVDQGCGNWRINAGRYHPMFQMPASEIPAAPLPKRQGQTILLQNRLNRPIWLTFHKQNGHYQEMNCPILPRQTVPWGQSYLFEWVTEKSMPGKVWQLPVGEGAVLSIP